jgi:hypothetical protein
MSLHQQPVLSITSHVLVQRVAFALGPKQSYSTRNNLMGTLSWHLLCPFLTLWLHNNTYLLGYRLFGIGPLEGWISCIRHGGQAWTKLTWHIAGLRSRVNETHVTYRRSTLLSKSPSPPRVPSPSWGNPRGKGGNSRIIYINSLRPSVCDGSFGGWGKGQGGEAAGDPFHSLDQST